MKPYFMCTTDLGHGACGILKERNDYDEQWWLTIKIWIHFKMAARINWRFRIR